VPCDIVNKISDLSSTPKTLSYGIKIAKIAHGSCFAYDTKLVAMATSLKESKMRSGSRKLLKYLPFGEKIVKIGPVDLDIICIKLKIEKQDRN